MDKISWYLEEDLNSHNQLFQNIEKVDYEVATFICVCGKIHIALKNKFQSLQYTCHECGNNEFFNANEAMNNFYSCMYFASSLKVPGLKRYSEGITIHFENDLYVKEVNQEFIDEEFEIELDSEVYLENNILKAHYYLKIPLQIDFLREKVHYLHKSIFLKSVDCEGKEDYNYEFPFLEELTNIPETLDKIERNLEQLLLQYLLDNNIFDIQGIQGYKKLSYKLMLYFLRNPNFKSIYFHDIDYELNAYSHMPGNILNSYKLIAIVDSLNREKSIKTAIFKNYEKQIKNKSFIMNFILAFHLTITDVNILKKLIDLNLEVVYVAPYKDICNIILFLKKYYSEVQVYKFFESFQKQHDKNMFEDLLYLYYLFLENNSGLDSFIRVKPRLKTIHDEFDRIYTNSMEETLKNIKFQYKKQIKRAANKINNYEVVLPQNGKELMFWGKELRNCLSSYAYMIEKQEIVVYGFFKNKKIDFAVEVDKGKIIQARSFNNKQLNKVQEIILNKWRKQYLIKHIL